MQIILSVAIVSVILASIVLVLRFRNLVLSGSIPVSLFAFIAILFTSGLDVGLIMFPLTNFPTYETEAVYAFANPLAIEFGFWGFLIWLFYFLTTFYFCTIEPKLQIFEIPWIKFINNVVIIGTCSFTGYLFLAYLPSYVDGITDVFKFGLVAVVVLCAVLSSTDIKYVKILSVSSTWVFFGLIALMAITSGMGVDGLVSTASGINDYFLNLHRFVTPISDHHAFYLFWWFAWSIMIGQFVARFAGGLKTWQLFVSLLVFPSIPIAAWFAVLYYYYNNQIEISGMLNLSMIVVGVIFVMNSLDSLTRLYTINLNLTVEKMGRPFYIIFHWTLIFGLALLYQFTPLKIEWVGLIVIGIYITVSALLLLKRRSLTSSPTS